MSKPFLFPTRMLKACWFTTLRDLGFHTTISLHNPLPINGLVAQDLCLSLNLFDVDGEKILSNAELGVLGPNERITYDISAIQVEHGIESDVVGVIMMTPAMLKGQTEVLITIEEVAKWTAMCDEFIGFTHEKARVQSGVHYQSPPMNDSRLRSTNTIIVQSPKIVLSQFVDSHLLVFAPTSNDNFSASIDLKLLLLEPNGNVAARGNISIPPRGRRRISLSGLFETKDDCQRFIDAGGLGMLVGLATGGVVTPLSLVADVRGGLAIDHTLPPPYYIPWWGGEARTTATQGLVKRLFAPVGGSCE